MVVPGFVLLLRMDLQRILAFLRWMREQGEVETLDRCCPFDCQFFTNSLLFFKSRNLMTAGTPVLLD
jgi:hypothetical protein